MITHRSPTEDPQKPNSVEADHEQDSDDDDNDVPSFVLHGPWPPIPLEHLAVKMNDSWVLGEVVNMCEDGKVLLRIFTKSQR